MPSETRRGRKRLSFWIELPILIAIALVVALVVRTFVLQTFYIPSGSMEKTLELNDQVLVNKLVYDFRPPERGEIIVFAPPANWDPAPGEDDFIKRVIGVGGDHVMCCSAAGKVTVNGVAISEPYLFPGNAPSERRFDVHVPQGRLFVLGDHREVSGDSRFHLDASSGTIPVDAVVGNAFAIYWPVSRWTPLSTPEGFEAVPAAATGR